MNTRTITAPDLDRRQFLGTGAAASAALLAPPAAKAAAATGHQRQPNIIFIVCDQLNLDAISGHGCRFAHTPNLDGLIERGVTFLESHSTNPVCSPARSTMFTGRMPVETGVITNTRPIHPSLPTMGTWLSQAGYKTAHCGKWHLPHGYPTHVKGFEVIPVGGGQGDLVDNTVSRLCQGFIRNHSGDTPYLLVASFLQPHDICYWAIMNEQLVPPKLPFEALRDQLPDLPPNNRVRPQAPRKLDAIRGPDFSDLQWQYYRYIYFRQVEMLDADVGRIMEAVEDSGQADNTIIVFTSDHGEGGGRHSHVQKWYPYEESVKVPLIVSCPARFRSNHRDGSHLVSGLDILPTLCDCAGIAPPPGLHGHSLVPLLEGRHLPWREFVASEHHVIGRMIRTERWKYVHYDDDPVEQLFDMHNDPWETTNLYDRPEHADTLRDHRRLLAAWRDRMTVVEPTRPLGR